MSLYSVFDAQTPPKRALLEYIIIPFSGQTAYVKFVLSCGFWHVLGRLRVFHFSIFLTFSEPASEDASVAPFYQLCVDFNSDLLSLLDPVASP